MKLAGSSSRTLWALLSFASLLIAWPQSAWPKGEVPTTAVYPPPPPDGTCYYNYQPVPSSLVNLCCENGVPKPGNIPGCPGHDDPSAPVDQVVSGVGTVSPGAQSDLDDTSDMEGNSPTSGLSDSSLAGGSAVETGGGGAKTLPVWTSGTKTGPAGSSTGGSGGSGSDSNTLAPMGTGTTPATAPSPSLANKLVGDILSTIDSFTHGQGGTEGGSASTEFGAVGAGGGVGPAGGADGSSDSDGAMSSEDPANYFSLTSPGDNIFKIVTRRYIAQVKHWAVQDASKLLAPAARPKAPAGKPIKM